jgi:glycosyltransferase involved in cell wall biosynthesis
VDAVQIVDAVRRVILDEELRQRLAQGATTFARTHLSWRRGAERLKDFYDEVLLGGRSSDGTARDEDVLEAH